MSTAADQWRSWSARAYGDDKQWKELNQKYWRSRWTIFRRCLWCRSGSGLTLNHLTYWPTKLRVGWVPLLFMVPLCQRCHHVETWLTRKLRKHRVRFGAHVVATFGVYVLTRSVLVGGLWYLLILWPGVPAPWELNWPG